MFRILCVFALLFGLSASAPACDVVLGGGFGGQAFGFQGQAFQSFGGGCGQPAFVQQGFSPFAFQQQQVFVSPFAFQQRAFINPFGVRRAVAFDAFGNPFVVRRQRGLSINFGF